MSALNAHEMTMNGNRQNICLYTFALNSFVNPVYCSVLQCVQYVAVCCSVLQCVVACCSVLPLYILSRFVRESNVCCSALQRVATCCGVLLLYIRSRFVR